jgi:hypothetical protein
MRHADYHYHFLHFDDMLASRHPTCRHIAITPPCSRFHYAADVDFRCSIAAPFSAMAHYAIELLLHITPPPMP